ncbi:hypothetical protein [Pseudonocardia sp. HH130630-07]|uniref:hypothetical protein n=1 Tax=Pseudonocardia sp. HH130630-07 TaxID=1690815 RepID=UPI00081500E6|nr:hypothetical protein [Pseudonocardia sp. HH130630-07]ANY05129.1 hypothetical protein AFB00_00980 [Pseudonocardia sp. HH130630-07]
MRIPALVLVLLVGAVGVACTGPRDDAAGLSGTVMQYRSDIAARVLTVRLRAERPTTVQRVELVPGGFGPSPAVTPAAGLGAGTTTDVRIPLGEPDCAAGPGPSTARITVGDEPVVIDLDDSYGAIAALHRGECAERAVRDRSDVVLHGPWVRAGDRLTGSLRLHRRAGTDPVAITELGGTTIFGMRPGAGAVLPLTLAAGPDAVLPVEILATRCDPHALAESKRATAFDVVATVAAEPPVRLTVSPDDREALLGFATDVCR